MKYLKLLLISIKNAKNYAKNNFVTWSTVRY